MTEVMQLWIVKIHLGCYVYQSGVDLLLFSSLMLFVFFTFFTKIIWKECETAGEPFFFFTCE